MKMRVHYVSIALLFLLVACGGDPTLGHLRAELTGHRVESYEGGATFSDDQRQPTDESSEAFSLSSRADDVEGIRRLAVFRVGGGRPAVGVHLLQNIDLGVNDAYGIVATYSRTSAMGDLSEHFVSTAGELVITQSTPDILEGTFAFDAERYCLRERVGDDALLEGPCSLVGETLDDAKIISVHGSFVAVPTSPNDDTVL